MNLQQKLERIGTALATGLAGTCEVWHYWRPKLQAPFCVWAEDGEDEAFDADNAKKEQVISGYVDYYTKTEYDPITDTIQQILNTIFEAGVFGWRLESVQYEDETNMIHYEWRWSCS